MRGTALIVGGGIGGLAAAIGLRRAGWEVRVLEKATTLGEVGAGISIWANGLSALDRLGLAGAVLAAGIADGDGWIRDRRGRPLLEVGSASLRRRYDQLGVVLYRPDLQKLLLDAVGRDVVRLGAALQDVVDEGGRVTAVLADGGSEEGDVLVGADGLHSVVRARLHGAEPPRYAGYTAWRAVLPAPAVALRPGESWGHGARFGHAPVPGDRVYLYATKNAREGEHAPDGERSELLRTFGGWHDPIPALLESVREEDLLRNDIYDRAPLRSWGAGRVTLLGDAAHPMTPNLGQGACQALEDAVVLARSLAGGEATGNALRRYEAVRAARANAFVVRSRRAGQMGQWSNRVAVRVRDFTARRLLARVQPRQMERMLAFQP